MTHDTDPIIHWPTLYERLAAAGAAFLRPHRLTPLANDNTKIRDDDREARLEDDIDPIFLMGDFSCTGSLAALSLLPFDLPSQRRR